MHLCRHFFPIAYRFLPTECPWFSLFFTTNHNHCFAFWNVFHVKDKKIPYATLHQVTRDRYFNKRWM